MTSTRPLLLLSLLAAAACTPPPPAVYQATGIKICEVDQDSAIIWARVTRDGLRVGSAHPTPIVRYTDPNTGELGTRDEIGGRPDSEPIVEFPDDSTIETIEGAVPGAAGEVRARYRLSGEGDWRVTGWHEVDPDADFIAHIELSGLDAGQRYELEVDARPAAEAEITSTIVGGFKTAPAPDDPARVVFTVTTGTSYPDQDAPEGGFKMYHQMLKLDPSFFVHTGDIIYYDRLAKSLPLAYWHWQRMYSLPTNVAFHRQVASYFIKDDHDVWMNESWPTMQTKFMGEFTFEQGRKVFLQEVGMREKTYRTIRWGKDLQIWLVEGRDFRSPNDMADGPDKTIWGAEQKEWFKRTVSESDATFRLLISPTPIVGPDRSAKNDNHANTGFSHEGDEIRQFIASQKNMYVACGDRHWQYVSQDAETGVREYSSGPASNEHAGGFSEDRRTAEHVYLNVIGGFLAGTVERTDGKPTLTFRHYGVEGDVLNEDRLVAEE
jgi:alkaline phosphatase D